MSDPITEAEAALNDAAQARALRVIPAPDRMMSALRSLIEHAKAAEEWLALSREEAQRRAPWWHDSGVGIVQGSHWRGGFAAGATWGLARAVKAESERDAAQARIDEALAEYRKHEERGWTPPAAWPMFRILKGENNPAPEPPNQQIRDNDRSE